MGDPTKAEPRNPSSGGETVQETADRMSGGGNPPHPSAVGGAGPAKFVNPSTKPSSPGNYGAPVGAPIFSGGNK
jgi:hypothetical protein